MGRIKTTLQKRLARKIVLDHHETLSTTFDANKQVVSKIADFPSKKLRNVVTGYITRLIRKGK